MESYFIIDIILISMKFVKTTRSQNSKKQICTILWSS